MLRLKRQSTWHTPHVPQVCLAVLGAAPPAHWSAALCAHLQRCLPAFMGSELARALVAVGHLRLDVGEWPCAGSQRWWGLEGVDLGGGAPALCWMLVVGGRFRSGCTIGANSDAGAARCLLKCLTRGRRLQVGKQGLGGSTWWWGGGW